MACRFIAFRLAALHAILFCSASLADTPLVIAELDVTRQIAEADAAHTRAEHELAVLQLTQLRTLRSQGHASWQEVARQEVTAKSLAATAQASEQYLQAVLAWQARLTKPDIRHSLTESEGIRLYLPGSARLVASVSAEVANPGILHEHLDRLSAEHQAVLGIDLSSLETAIAKARKNVEFYGRSDEDPNLLSRAKIRLRLAHAAYASAKTRKESANTISRRMSLVGKSIDKQQTSPNKPSPALAHVGTPFVDATSDRELARLVEAMAVAESMASERIAWLTQQRDAVLAEVDALRELSEHLHADPVELEQAQRRKSDLDLEIALAQDLLAMKQKIAGDDERKSELRLTHDNTQAESLALDDACFTGASEVRHCLQLQQLELQTSAKLAAVKAQRDYLVERLRRVERIDEQARPPKELDHLRHKLQGIEQQLEMVDGDLALLTYEQQRFYHQVRSQHGEQYQLVQADRGGFISREQFEVGAGLMAVVGFVGQGELLAKLPIMHPYIESTNTLDCLSQLSFQAPRVTTEIDSLIGWRSSSGSRRSGFRSDWRTPHASGGLRLATDAVTYPKDLLCYRPYEFWQVRPETRWASHDYFRPAATRGFRSFDPYDRYPFGSCGRSIFSYRVGSPTRASFPYRSSYLYRTAFPVRSNLYSYPYARPSSLAGNCFD